jgi:hypothetical protein
VSLPIFARIPWYHSLVLDTGDLPYLTLTIGNALQIVP